MGIENGALGVILTTCAGMSTLIGAGLVYCTVFVKHTSPRVLAASLGCANGVMMYISLVEILAKAEDGFVEDGLNPQQAKLYATLFFFLGVICMFGVDLLVHKLTGEVPGHDLGDAAEKSPPLEVVDVDPGASNECRGDIEALASKTDEEESSKSGSEEIPSLSRQKHTTEEKKALNKMGLTTALAIAIHNFPEGLATFVATLSSPGVGVAMAIGIAIHNIPEGVCVSIPIYYGTGNRHKAFMWSFVSALSEPISALMAYFLLSLTGVNGTIYGVLFGIVAGMMVFVCVHELSPTARRYDPKDTVVSKATFVGMALMGASLVLLEPAE